MIKQWPDNDDTVDLDEIIDPIVASIHEAYALDRININQDIPYDGFEIGKFALANVPNVKQKLSAEYLERRLECGYDALSELIHITVLLGMEQGRRMQLSNNVKVTTLNDLIDEANALLKLTKTLNKYPVLYEIDSVFGNGLNNDLVTLVVTGIKIHDYQFSEGRTIYYDLEMLYRENRQLMRRYIIKEEDLDKLVNKERITVNEVIGSQNEFAQVYVE